MSFVLCVPAVRPSIMQANNLKDRQNGAVRSDGNRWEASFLERLLRTSVTVAAAPMLWGSGEHFEMRA
jgi:hypothetical protein